MSDIQRYHPTWGTAEGYNMSQSKTGYYVKYDDYIEEIKTLVAVVQQFIDNPESKAARQAVINALNYYEKLKEKGDD